MLISAHRGGGGDAIVDELSGEPYAKATLGEKLAEAHKRRPEWENRLDTFRAAFAGGVRSAELDLWLSKDGVPMVIHDPNLKRTHGIDLNVADATAEELQTHGVPTLAAVLDMAQGFQDTAKHPPKIFLELKSPRVTPYTEAAEKTAVPLSAKDVELADKVAREVSARVTSKRWDYRDLPVIGFNHEQLLAVRKTNPYAETGWSFEPANFGPSSSEAKKLDTATEERILRTVRRDGGSAINPAFGFLGIHGDIVKKAHDLGLEVNVWTLNNPGQVQKAVETGADSVITDFPVMAEKAIADRQAQLDRSRQWRETRRDGGAQGR